MEAQDINHKDPKLPVEALEPSEMESEPASEVEAEPSEVEFELSGPNSGPTKQITSPASPRMMAPERLVTAPNPLTEIRGTNSPRRLGSWRKRQT